MEHRFEIEVKARLGSSKHDDKAVCLLNRPIEWTEQGIRYEADQRHAEIIVRDLGLVGNAKSVTFPFEKKSPEEIQVPTNDLGSRESTIHRAVVARGNYLGQQKLLLPYRNIQ